MSFESNRLKGLIASLLMILVPILFGITSGTMSLLGLSTNSDPYISIINIILNVAFYFLFYNAMSGFAEYYDDSKILKNSLYAVIMGITGLITAPIVSYIIDMFSPNILFFVLILVYMTVIAIPTGFFFRRAFYEIEEKSGQHYFKQAGSYLWYGGILTIIVVGILFIFIGRIFAILGFYYMKPKSS